jgi:GT2 family glycosyltransferase
MKRAAVSVVIPTYNGCTLLAKHLPQVAAVLQEGDEILIVDDASTDGTIPWLEEQVPVYKKKKIELHIVAHSTNKRFAAAVNSGVEAAKNPFVFLLNNDVSPLSKNILDTLSKWFEDPLMFAVGCAEVHEESKSAQVYGRGTGGWQRGLLVHWYDSNQTSNQTLWTAGGSMLFDREKFLEIGGMDTLYYPAYEEDRDLSYRALKHGWKITFEPKARVLHQHETTNASVFGQRKMQIDSWKNQYLLVWKNITDLSFLLQHLLWLPYHIIIGGLRSQGTATLGFFAALKQLPQALAQRLRVKKLWKLSDEQVLSQFTEK